MMYSLLLINQIEFDLSAKICDISDDGHLLAITDTQTIFIYELVNLTKVEWF